MHAALAGNHQILRRQHADERAAGLTEPRQVQSLQQRVILDVVRRRAVRLLPDDVAGVHVVGGDAVVRRLEDRQPLHGGTRHRRRGPARRRAACAGDIRHIRLRGTGRRHEAVDIHVRVRVDVEEVVLRIHRPAGPVRSANLGRHLQRRRAAPRPCSPQAA